VVAFDIVSEPAYGLPRTSAAHKAPAGSDSTQWLAGAGHLQLINEGNLVQQTLGVHGTHQLSSKLPVVYVAFGNNQQAALRIFLAGVWDEAGILYASELDHVRLDGHYRQAVTSEVQHLGDPSGDEEVSCGVEATEICR
jgi:hypothetical protein